MSRDVSGGFEKILTGMPKQSSRAAEWLMEGTIQSVDTVNHTVSFIIPEFGKDHAFNDRPYGLGHSSPPTVGDTCLVAFVGNGLKRTWVISWKTDS